MHYLAIKVSITVSFEFSRMTPIQSNFDADCVDCTTMMMTVSWEREQMLERERENRPFQIFNF